MSDEDMSAEDMSAEDMVRFEMMAGHVRTIAEVMIAEHFGDRCPDYEKTCEVCRRWKLLDQLTAKP